MNSTTVLQSNLLDIIFENRNKDYGAYPLRKFYNNRLCMAVSTMMSIVVLFSLLQFFWNNKGSLLQKNIVFNTPDFNPSNFENKPKAILFPATQKQKINQKKIQVETTPKIVEEKNINKSVATINPPLASDLIIPGNEQTGINEKVDFDDGSGNKLEGEIKPMLSEKPKSSKVILNEADVMPQYPGGLKALLAYLKKNLQTPDDVEEGKEISVKVKFVVNYDGKLEMFKVIQSGGEAFDNEVLRVLQKMPQWIPGKSNGENVAVYFTVPVKFTSNF